MIQKFWMVHGLQRGAPAVRHYTRQSADIEAERLATKHPGEFFAVLKAINVFNAQVNMTSGKPTIGDGYDDGIPF